MFSDTRTHNDSGENPIAENNASSDKHETSNKGSDTQEDLNLSPEQERIKQLEAELSTAQAKYNEHIDRMMRIAAEADNQRKRLEKEKVDSRVYAIQEFAKDLLPVLDTFDKSTLAMQELKINTESEEGKKTSAVFEGVSLVSQTLQNTLKKHGIERLPGKGAPFNPSYHNAISKVTDSAYTSDTVVEEFVIGYKIGDRVLRSALVKVGSPD